jgi:hypothetical protein
MARGLSPKRSAMSALPRRALPVAAILAMTLAASPAPAQVGGLGAPTAADSLERNISGLKSPGGGGSVGVSPTGVPSPQQSLDSNISWLKPTPGGRIRSTAPRLRYAPPTTTTPSIIAQDPVRSRPVVSNYVNTGGSCVAARGLPRRCRVFHHARPSAHRHHRRGR